MLHSSTLLPSLGLHRHQTSLPGRQQVQAALKSQTTHSDTLTEQ